MRQRRKGSWYNRSTQSLYQRNHCRTIAAAGMKHAACAADDHERNGMHRPRNPLVGGDAGCRMPVAVVCRDHARAANRVLQALACAVGGFRKPPKHTEAVSAR